MKDRFETYYFSILNNFYPDFLGCSLFFKEKTEEILYRPIQSFEKLELLINQYAEHLDLSVSLVEIEQEFEELDRGMPLSCDIIEPEDKNNFKIGVSLFGKSNLDITLNEIILLLVQEKLLKDALIPFDEDFINDDDEFIPFLVFSSIYFGLSKPLIYRISSSGNYYMNSFENASYTYYLPIQKEDFINSLILCAKQKNMTSLEFLKELPNLDEEIKKITIQAWEMVGLES